MGVGVGVGVGVQPHEQKQRRHRPQEAGEASGDRHAAESSPSLAALYLYGDVLESVLERVPAADLAAAARVSHEWLSAVRSALRRRPRRLPWLVVHLHGRRRQTAAYDPHSGTWITVPAPRHATPSHVRLVRGARGDRVCALSFSGLDVAGDSLGTSACVALKAPAVWRVDPVFAAVGDRVVALGGACQLALAEGEDAAAVEVHESGNWTACDPMPAALRESAAATWLSAAATDHRVYLTDRTTGWASWFDPAERRWGPTRRLRPDATVSTWGVAPGRACAERLVLFGAKRGGEGAEKNRVVIQAWEVDGDALDLSSPGALARDAMPREMSERLFPHDEEEEEETPPSIGVCGNGTGGYVYNAAEPANGAALYELGEGEEGSAVERWEWVPCAPEVRADPLGRAILACSPVGLEELSRGAAVMYGRALNPINHRG